MAYYLAVERVPNSYEAINIKKTTKGRNKFKDILPTYECTLEEIDKYTSEYDSLERMSHDLHGEKKVQWSNCSLAIVSVNGIEIRIKQNMLFSNSKKYLENPNLVAEYILNQYKDTNITFFKYLITVLSEKEKNKVENLITELEKSIVSDILYDESIVLSVIKSLIYTMDNQGNLYEDKLNYEKLHDIVSFIATYEENLNMINNQSHVKARRKNA